MLHDEIPISVLNSASIRCLSLSGNNFIFEADYCAGRLPNCCDQIATTSISSTTEEPVSTTTTPVASDSESKMILFRLALSLALVASILMLLNCSWTIYVRSKIDIREDTSDASGDLPSEELILSQSQV